MIPGAVREPPKKPPAVATATDDETDPIREALVRTVKDLLRLLARTILRDRGYPSEESPP